MKNLNRAFLRDIWLLSRGFWTSDYKWKARLLAVAIIAMQLVYVSIMVYYNSWQKDFYNTIQEVSPEHFFYYLKFWPMYMVTFIFIEVNRDYLMQYLEIRCMGGGQLYRHVAWRPHLLLHAGDAGRRRGYR